MRGQVSLEIFFSVSLFVLLLFWLNHFVGVAAEATNSDRAVFATAFSLAHAADAACRLNLSVNLPSPCLADAGPLVLSVGQGTLNLNGVGVSTACQFQPGQFVVPGCGKRLCVQSLDAGGAVLRPEPCSGD
ncbi:hypothetical protein HY572_03980 [Candidatus Micrarchaeota archaeon]|nr:hypothetical protein [Candidatus Micrarchaeota archaeon]